MKNTLRTLLACSTIAFGLATAASAADVDAVRINVPFAFKAGKTTLPAGDYMVSEQGSNVVTLKGSHGSAILLGVPSDEADPTKTSLTFDHTDGGYVLKCVHGWGKSVSSAVLTPSQTEK